MAKLYMEEEKKNISGNRITAPIEDIAAAGNEYINLRIDEIKLSLIEGLSVASSRFLVHFIIVILLLMAGLLLSIGGVLLLGKLLGSDILAATVLALMFIIPAVIIFLCRKRLFVNGFVRMFMSIFFTGKEE